VLHTLLVLLFFPFPFPALVHCAIHSYDSNKKKKRTKKNEEKILYLLKYVSARNSAALGRISTESKECLDSLLLALQSNINIFFFFSFFRQSVRLRSSNCTTLPAP